MSVESNEQTPRLRIGELSRRTGVSTDTLRAWERRYSLLAPARSDGGFRLYGVADETRVNAMKGLIETGLSPAEAAREALAGATRPDSPPAETPAAAGPDRLLDALGGFDEAAAHAALDDAVASLSIDALLSTMVLPALERIGERWSRGEISVAEEHFATNVLRGRLLGLARNWGVGTGPRALLACPPGELHDLGLIAFGLALRARGWRITYLGPDTPVETVADAASRLEPDLVVLAALERDRFRAAETALEVLAGTWPVALAGAGADEALADRLGAELISGGPVAAAAGLAADRR